MSCIHVQAGIALPKEIERRKRKNRQRKIFCFEINCLDPLRESFIQYLGTPSDPVDKGRSLLHKQWQKFDATADVIYFITSSCTFVSKGPET